jgi:hypothetical protein
MHHNEMENLLENRHKLSFVFCYRQSAFISVEQIVFTHHEHIVFLLNNQRNFHQKKCNDGGKSLFTLKKIIFDDFSRKKV